nr:hypothetical protein [Tanacetum cinerariifolium]
MHTGSSWISKRFELTLKYFVRSSRFVPDSPTKILLTLLLKKKWFHLSKNSSTLASVICYLRSIQIICISPGEHLLLSSIGASLGSPQEDFMFQANNREISSARKENMPYPRFTKLVINHFISKDKTISMRNKINLHPVRDDTLLGILKFVSKTEDYHKYGALISEEMINQAIKDSKAYKIYLDFTTRKATSKKARKFKKIASPLQKLTTVLEEETTKKPKRAKKPEPTKQAKTEKKTALANKSSTIGKGMDLLFDVALLKAAQLKKVLKKSKQDTNMLHVSGLDDGVGYQPKVPDELQDKITGTNEGTSTIPGVPDVPKDQSESENKSCRDSGDADDSNDDNDNDDDEEEKQDDEYVHTPEHYVPTEDETNDETDDVTEEEYERINEELYGDVNVRLTDAEPDNKDKDDEETTAAGHVNVNQEGAGNLVKDDAQATHNTEGPISSSSIPSDYAAKYLNFDNIPPVDTKVFSLLDINVQHEVPRTSPLLTIPVFVIPKHTIVNPPETVTTAITNLEKDVKELKTIDHSAALLSTIKSEVLNAVNEYLGTSLDDALYKKTTLFETMTKSMSFNKSPRNRALHHALIESILEDEDAMDKGVADKLKKIKQDDADKNEGPSGRSDRGLKREKTSKDIEPSKKA